MPRGRRGALQQAVKTASARSTRLQAVYADTAGRHLAAAGMALRLRKEGRVWVQTLKGRGDGLASRFEHEVVLQGVKGLPTLDARLHDGTALAAPLQRALQQGGPLLPVYRTDIQRLHRRLRSQGAVIEIALDRGHLIAGPRSALVHEIEFELISGPASALPQLAAPWAAKFGLWWDVRTKSERGFRLAQGLDSVPAAPRTHAGPAAAKPGAATDWKALLAHALPNAAALADATSAGLQGPALAPHLGQLSLALQALAQALQPGHAELAAQARQLLADLAELQTAPAVVRGPAFTALMLLVLALALQPAARAAPARA